MKVIDSVENYITSEFTDRALLVTGGWGAGKTYFWKNSILPIIKKNHLNPIYISLHGVSTLEQLEAQFLTSLLPSKMQKTVYQNAVNIVSKKLLGSGLNEVFKGAKWPELNNAIICYDDLERNKIELDELWGFINYYIEHVNLKTIIISNEEEIKKEFYKSKKEKNISRSIQFTVDIEDVYDSLILKYKSPNQEFYSFLENQKRTVIDYLKKFEIENLRTVSLFLENIRTIYNHGHSKRHSFHKVILFSLIITNEFALGNLSSADLSDYKGLNKNPIDMVARSLMRQPEREEETQLQTVKTYLETIHEKYLSHDGDDYFFFPATFKYIVAGLLDIDAIRKETDLPLPQKTPEHISVLDTLMNPEFRKLKNEDFNELLPKFLNWTEEGVYSIYDYTRIASGLDFYRTNGLLVSTEKKLEGMLFRGLKEAFKNSNYNQSLYDNIFAFDPKCDLERKIRNELKILNTNLCAHQLGNQFNKVLELLEQEEHNQLIELMEKLRMDQFLEYGDPKRLVNTLLNCTNETLFYFEQIIFNRYNYSNVSDFMMRELDFITEANKQIKAFLSTSPREQPNAFLLKSISDKLSDTETRFNK